MDIQIVVVAQLCLSLCDSMDCSLPGSSVHGILQARILEWVAIPFSKVSSQPRDQSWVSCMTDRFLPPDPIIMYLHDYHVFDLLS